MDSEDVHDFSSKSLQTECGRGAFGIYFYKANVRRKSRSPHSRVNTCGGQIFGARRRPLPKTLVLIEP